MIGHLDQWFFYLTIVVAMLAKSVPATAFGSLKESLQGERNCIKIQMTSSRAQAPNTCFFVIYFS